MSLDQLERSSENRPGASQNRTFCEIPGFLCQFADSCVESSDFPAVAPGRFSVAAMPTCSPPENALGTEARQRVTTMNHEPSSSETSLESEPPSRSAQKDASVDEAGVAALELVPSSLRTAITQRGFQSLTSVQVAALERAGTDSDLRISSQTGSGKTVAIGLAVCLASVAVTLGGTARRDAAARRMTSKTPPRGRGR